MENFCLQELVSAVKGEFISGNPHMPVPSVSIDSRTLRRGDFFVAISGKNFDGHDFLLHAVEKKAGGIVISRQDVELGEPIASFPAIVRVTDTFAALGDLAAGYRRKWDVPVVAVTGSNGKTTTREMIASILRLQGETLSTCGNLNNQIGLPLTLLNLGSCHRYAVVEMGTSFPGEIRRLAEIAAPSVAVITNIGLAHLENFKDREGVFAEKRSLFDVLPDSGLAVINADDPYLGGTAGTLGRETISFGIEKQADVMAGDITLWPDKPCFRLSIQGQTIGINLPVHGRFNIYNALAAAAAAWKLGAGLETIKQGLEHFSCMGMRMEVCTLVSGTMLLNDAYNANPSSMRESLRSLVAAFPDREKVVVLGDMLEMGESAEPEHSRLGEFIATLPLSRVYLFGPLMEKAFCAAENPAAKYYQDKEDLIDELKRSLPQGAVILFKGSRGMRLEEVVEKVFNKEE